jgi:hypothetical protein
MAVSKRQIMSVRDWARTVSLHTSSRRQYLSSLGAPPGPVQAELRLLEASCERLVRLVDAGHRA